MPKVRAIMTTNVATAEPDTTLEEVATLMRDENVGAIPIIEDDELVGIITDRDVVVCATDPPSRHAFAGRRRREKPR